jgi:predicted O-methyltransferase YrrM
MKDWLAKLFDNPDLARMGHLQRVADGNLGLGWLYYALARIIRPRTAVVIGSYRGFVPLVLGKALADNLDGGEVIFIDPSLVDDFWKDPQAVREYFARFEVGNVRHFLMTTQQFVQSEAYRSLGRLGMLFVDGYHTEEQARFDYEAFERLLDPAAVVLFHDTARCEVSHMYGPHREYERRVKVFIDKLKQDSRLQVFDLPFGEGVTLVRKLGGLESETARKLAGAARPEAAADRVAQP